MANLRYLVCAVLCNFVFLCTTFVGAQKLIEDYVSVQFPNFNAPSSIPKAINIQMTFKEHAEELEIILDPIGDTLKTTVIILADSANPITPSGSDYLFDFTMSSLKTAAVDLTEVLDVKQYTSWESSGIPSHPSGNTVTKSGEQTSVDDYPSGTSYLMKVLYKCGTSCGWTQRLSLQNLQYQHPVQFFPQDFQFHLPYQRIRKRTLSN